MMARQRLAAESKPREQVVAYHVDRPGNAMGRLMNQHDRS
jgi:hypothetical protein